MNLLAGRPERGNPALAAVSESDTTAPGSSSALQADDRSGGLPTASGPSSGFAGRQVRQPTAAREQIEYIDIDRIDDDPRNFYELSGLDELAANIELLGLQQPIRVRPGEEAGRYIIVSGHRRRAAVRKLVMDGHGELRDLPCIVERNQESAALQELRLIYANSDTRKMTSADISRQAERVEALLYQLKEEGYDFPGRMRDHVAEACKISKSKLARLDVIRKSLARPWRPAYEKGKLAESAAYALAQMPQERQKVIFDGLKKQGGYPAQVYEYTIQAYGRKLAEADRVQCKTYGKGPCLNREAMQRRIMDKESWAYNYCRQCCDKCSELAKCKYACPMLADKVKQLKADAKLQRQQEQAAREEKERPRVDQIKALWKRFGEARAAAGTSMGTCLETVGAHYGAERKASEFEELERLEGKINENTTLPYGYSCYLSEVRRYVNLADLLGVSLDYLLCRTDDPKGSAYDKPVQNTPEGQLVIAGWMPGGTLPSTDCDVVVDFDLGGGRTVRESCRFFKGTFRFGLDDDGDDIDLPVVRWMALPPVVSDSGTGEGTV